LEYLLTQIEKDGTGSMASLPDLTQSDPIGAVSMQPKGALAQITTI